MFAGRNPDAIILDIDLHLTLLAGQPEDNFTPFERTAIAATILKDSDVYFFDEPSSYLDIYQRIKVARIIQELSVEKQVVVIEHDLAILDFLADNVYLVYGSEGAFGVFAQPRQVRISIHTYLDGYLREENIRFRDYPIVFEERPPRDSWQTVPLLEYDAMECHYPSFRLRGEEGTIKVGESVGVVGPNAFGTTTIVKVLAGVMPPTMGQVKSTLKVSIGLDLRGPNGGGDAAADTVTVNSTQGADTFGVAGGAGGVNVFGLHTAVNIFAPEQANDRLILNGLGGDDVMDATALKADGIQLTLNGGLGADVLFASEGNDLINGGGVGANTAATGAGTISLQFRMLSDTNNSGQRFIFSAPGSEATSVDDNQLGLESSTTTSSPYPGSLKLRVGNTKGGYPNEYATAHRLNSSCWGPRG